jgi:hypothetical protein
MNAPVMEVLDDGEALARRAQGGVMALSVGWLRPQGEPIWFVDGNAGAGK